MPSTGTDKRTIFGTVSAVDLSFEHYRLRPTMVAAVDNMLARTMSVYARTTDRAKRDALGPYGLRR